MRRHKFEREDFVHCKYLGESFKAHISRIPRADDDLLIYELRITPGGALTHAQECSLTLIRKNGETCKRK
jgi:hypothetical protein